MRSRIMYIEDKSQGLTGPGRIGRVAYSKTGATLTYGDRSFQSLKGSGFKANYFDVETGDEFWISGPRRDGADGLYGRITQPEDVDEDVAEPYWRDIRGLEVAPPTAARTSIAGATAEAAGALEGVVVRPGRSRQRIARIINQRRQAQDS